jgi:hypothetical protein
LQPRLVFLQPQNASWKRYNHADTPIFHRGASNIHVDVGQPRRLQRRKEALYRFGNRLIELPLTVFAETPSGGLFLWRNQCANGDHPARLGHLISPLASVFFSKTFARWVADCFITQEKFLDLRSESVGGNRILTAPAEPCGTERFSQMIFLPLSLALGLLLALRFKVFVLLPANLLVVMVALAGGVAGTEALWWRAVMAGLGVASLEIGYFLGLVAWSTSQNTPRRTVSRALPE